MTVVPSIARPYWNVRGYLACVARYVPVQCFVSDDEADTLRHKSSGEPRYKAVVAYSRRVS